ncbi:hypothetical protein QFC20_001559 [Naganishia adeliensis]|uniref:Uncharacterized protein n=1 Tax=Naganishia adeliensis TaxID=92952 RepID=A0ACC2WUC2_9TREE|nr:hypothetical protein QFC20_001559 [Naganishia adeliensis]
MSGYSSPRRDSSHPPLRHGLTTPTRSRNSSRAPSRIASRRGSLSSPAPVVDAVTVLTDSANFQDLPSTDPLSSLIARYVPVETRPIRDVSGEWRGRTIEELVATGSWRALACYARDQLVAREIRDIPIILELWHIRLHALLRLQLSAQHTRELSTLDRALAYVSRKSIEHGNIQTFVPFEIDVFRAKAAREADGTAYEALVGLLRRCQERARDAKGEERDVWVQRAGRVGAVLVGSLLEHKQYSTALGLLEDLYPSPAKDAQITQDQLHALIIRFLIHLCLGTTHHAAALFPLLKLSAIPQEKKDILQGLLWTCQGRAGDVVARAGIRSDSQGMVDLVVANNEAVAMLETGALTEAIERLSSRMQAHEPDSYVEPYIFNMATLAELDSGSAIRRKVDILERAASATGEVIKHVETRLMGICQPAAFKLA